MANIKLTNLTTNAISGSFIQDLSKDELALQGGGLFRFRRPPAPPIIITPPTVIPDILIGFTPGLSI
jgi:hypothetical protein